MVHITGDMDGGTMEIVKGEVKEVVRGESSMYK
jgi:hypothetical protein